MRRLQAAFCTWLVFGCVLVVLGKGAKQPKMDIRTIVHQKVKLREHHGYAAETVPGDFLYLAQVEVLETVERWHRVRPLEAGGVEGWLHDLSLTTKKVPVGKPGSSAVKRLKKGEGDLAAPGFRPKIEQRYRQETPGLQESFARLDQLEARDPELLPSTDDLVSFRLEGRLKPFDGGES